MRSPSFPPVGFPDHELLDSGGGEKLERFGPVVLRRPDPQAMWRPRLGSEAWESADLAFERESDRGGRWIARSGAHELARARRAHWPIAYGAARLMVRPTPFKHVGIFPEQAPNWELLPRVRAELDVAEPRLLHLFAYTGAASVIARQAGFHVTHVDASKASIEWAVDNAIASGLARDSMRLVLDDALGFVRREARRKARYHVVFLDPPHYGRGPAGEKWQLETGLPALVDALAVLLEPRALVVLSTYAVGHSSISLANLLADLGECTLEQGELVLRESGPAERLLPAGFCARAWRGLEPLESFP